MRVETPKDSAFERAFFAFLEGLKKVILPVALGCGIGGMILGFSIGGVGGAILGFPVGFALGFAFVWLLPLVLVGAGVILGIGLVIAAVLFILWGIIQLWGVGRP